MLEIKLTSCMKENEIRELCLLEKRVYSCTNCMINPPPWREYQPMSFGGKNMKSEREKGENGKGKGRKGK
jgi:hypothetical protein